MSLAALRDQTAQADAFSLWVWLAIPVAVVIVWISQCLDSQRRKERR